MPYSGFAATAYDAATALMDAFRRAAPPRGGPEVLKQLKDVKFSGKSGLISFDEYGDLRYDPATGYTVGAFDRVGNLKQERAAGEAAAAADPRGRG